MKTNPYEPINPFENKENGYPIITIGLTKREYFAAMALQGIVSSKYMDGDDKYYSHIAVIYADALINELNNDLS